MTFENQILTDGIDENETEKENKSEEKERIEREKIEAQEKRFTERLRNFFIEIFENSADPEERFAEFVKRLQIFLIVSDDNFLNQVEIDEVKDSFKASCSLEDREVFIEQGLTTLEPLIEWERKNKPLFEAKMRKNFIETSGFIPLNESLSYGKYKKIVNIHVAPSETLSAGTQLSLLKDGLRKLQEVLKNDEEIEAVTASSWIVATEKGGKIMEKLGFTVVGEISPEMKEKHFRLEKRQVDEAFIKREDFLKQSF